MPPGLATLAVVAVVAAISPIIVGALRGRVPQVVVLIALGVVVGPEVLAWADADDITLVSDIGLGLLFLLAGYELDLTIFRERAGRLAIVSWVVSIAIAAAGIGALFLAGDIEAFAVIAIALTTTALGTLLPILRENDLLGGRLGRCFFAAGAVGEFAPIIAIAIFLGSGRSAVAVVLLALLVAVTLLVAVAPARVRWAWLTRVVLTGEHATAQTTLRITMALLIVLLFVTAEFGFDIVLGAFLAGMVVRRWSPGDVRALELKLDAVAYGFFIPVFFVSSGLTLDVISVLDAPYLPFVFLLLLLVVRGAPVLVLYRGVLDRVERVQLAFLAATALPLLVALTAIGVDEGVLSASSAASVVFAGVLSVLLFPAAAVVVGRRYGRTPPAADSADAPRPADPGAPERDSLDL